MEDAVAISGNLAKHLTIANATLKYLENRICTRLNKEPQDLSIERELITVLVDSYTAVNKIKILLHRILNHIDKIKPNFPGDYIYPQNESKNSNGFKKYIWHAISASTAGYLIYYFRVKILGA